MILHWKVVPIQLLLIPRYKSRIRKTRTVSVISLTREVRNGLFAVADGLNGIGIAGATPGALHDCLVFQVVINHQNRKRCWSHSSSVGWIGRPKEDSQSSSGGRPLGWQVAWTK